MTSMRKEKSNESAPRPKLVKLNKAYNLAVKWVSEMSKATDDDSSEVQLEGRPLGLGLGAVVPRHATVGPVTDPVERRLRANIAIGKRRANDSIEKASEENVAESSEEDEDEDDSRTRAFAKKKVVHFDPSSQSKKNKKKK